MVDAYSYARAFKKNCPGVRLAPEETDELSRLFIEAKKDAIAAYEAAHPDHVMVPREPTEAMIEAGLDDPDAAYCDRCMQSGFTRNSGHAAVVYKAMIAAYEQETTSDT